MSCHNPWIVPNKGHHGAFQITNGRTLPPWFYCHSSQHAVLFINTMWNVQVQSRLGSAGKEGHSWRASFSFQGSLQKRQNKEETKMEGDVGSCVFAPCAIEARITFTTDKLSWSRDNEIIPVVRILFYCIHLHTPNDLQLLNANNDIRTHPNTTSWRRMGLWRYCSKHLTTIHIPVVMFQPQQKPLYPEARRPGDLQT